MTDPTAIDAYLANANHALDNATKCVPEGYFKGCSGVILVSGKQGGLGISGQAGKGVVVRHEDGKWSSPVAVTLGGVGAGAVIGLADKDMVVCLNDANMAEFLEGHGKFGFGADVGFATGSQGAAAGTNLGADTSKKGTWTNSHTFSCVKGVIVNAEVVSTWVNPDNTVNNKFYGTDHVKDIIEGKVAPPDGSKAPELLDRLAKLSA